MMASVQLPPMLSRKLGKVEMWPTAMRYDLRDGVLVGTVTAWGPRPGRPEAVEVPKSKRGAAAQGAFDL